MRGNLKNFRVKVGIHGSSSESMLKPLFICPIQATGSLDKNAKG